MNEYIVTIEQRSEHDGIAVVSGGSRQELRINAMDFALAYGWAEETLEAEWPEGYVIVSIVENSEMPE